MDKKFDKLILHCDLNNFYASVECLLKPELKDVPMAVCGDPEKRHGIILAKNEKAKALGVKTAEPIWAAQQKARGLVLVPPHYDLYMQYSEQVFELYTRFTPQVEPFGPDECWLDVSGCTRLFGTGHEIADKIRKTVFEQTGLTISAGVSFNKVFAKMGSDLKKPNATSEISRENYKALLWPLEVDTMPGIGKKTAEKLQKINIRTLGDLAAADEELLFRLFGISGRHMMRDVRGENTDTVREAVVSRQEKSIGHGMTTTLDLCSYADAETVLYYLTDRVAARLRKKGLRAGGIALDLRNSGLSHTSHQKKLENPAFASAELSKAAVALLHESWKETPPLRTLTVSTFDLSEDGSGVQIGMFGDEKREKSEQLDQALDKIKQKYGGNSILRGNLIGRDFLYDKNNAEDFLPFKR